MFRAQRKTTLFEWSAGFGGQVYNKLSQGIFAEFHNYNPAGGLANHWVINMGYAFYAF